MPPKASRKPVQKRKPVPAPHVPLTPVVRVPGLTGAEIALIDRAAGAEKRSRADWCRLALLAAASTQLAPNAPAGRAAPFVSLLEAAGAATRTPPCKLCGGVGTHKPACPARPPLTKSFDPDA